MAETKKSKRSKSSIKVVGLHASPIAPRPTRRTSATPPQMDWYKFGSDNLFPQAISALIRRSTSLRGVLDWKNRYVVGSGFKSDSQPLLDYIESVNAKAESLRAVYSRLQTDNGYFGNSYLELITDRRGNVLQMFHKDATKCRVGARKWEGNILFHEDWANVESSKNEIRVIPTFVPGKPIEQGEDGVFRACVHFKDYEPGFTIYGIPGWIAGLDAGSIGYKTTRWNLSRLENSFYSSGVLILEGEYSDKEVKELEDLIKEKFTGAERAGKILQIIKQPGSTAKTEWLPLTQEQEGDWIKLHTQSRTDIIEAANWFEVLSGQSQPGKLGQSNEIRTAYEIANATIIPSIRQELLDPIRKIITNLAGIDASDLRVIGESPVSFADKIDINKVITRGQGYALLNIPPPKEASPEELNQVISKQTDNNNGNQN